MDNTSNNGFLISFEGLDNSGKSTQINLLKTYLKSINKKVKVVESLGGLQSVNLIKEILLNKDVEKIDSVTELLLYQAARRELVVKQIKPALEEGKIVILDRYIDSSLVYQGILRNIDSRHIDYLNNFVTKQLKPNITFFLKIKKPTYLQRINDTEINKLDKIEIDSMYKFDILNEAYEYLSHIKNNFISIEEDSIENVFNKIISHLKFL